MSNALDIEISAPETPVTTWANTGVREPPTAPSVELDAPGLRPAKPTAPDEKVAEVTGNPELIPDATAHIPAAPQLLYTQMTIQQLVARAQDLVVRL